MIIMLSCVSDTAFANGMCCSTNMEFACGVLGLFICPSRWIIAYAFKLDDKIVYDA
jgi:hypothetical protein